MTASPIHSGRGQPPSPSRIRILEMLEAAGPSGLEACVLIAEITSERFALTDSSARARLFKDKMAGRIFGKGSYLKGRGIRYWYFAKQEWCDAHQFEEVSAEARKLIRLEKARIADWAKRGVSEPPPRKVYMSRAGMTADELRTRDSDRRRAKRQAEAAAQGRTIRVHAPKGLGKRAKAKARAQAALPGSALVAPDTSRPVPVTVPKRPVLVGELVITSATRVTVAPVARDYRFWVDPAAVRPVFGALRPGQYWGEEELGRTMQEAA